MHISALEAESTNNIVQGQVSYLLSIPHQSRWHCDCASERKAHSKRKEVMGYEKGKVLLLHNNLLLWKIINIPWEL